MFLVFRPWFLLLLAFTVVDACVTAAPKTGSARAVLEARARSAFRVDDAPVGGALDLLTRDPAPRSRVRVFLPDTSVVAAGQPMPSADEIRPRSRAHGSGALTAIPCRRARSRASQAA